MYVSKFIAMSKQAILRTVFFVLVALGIFVIYYTMVILKDFAVFTNPDGPDTSDYFLIEEME